ncbi:hypothetical protein AB1Y20_009050 [Prymnesium parvum]|uniref:FACT complex subunit n=1 Tax=Prymnesium parvum TaxID=97485 RepID=A0AB34K5J5_PRYPA
MPRRPSTCAALRRPEAEWCSACQNPRLKARCSAAAVDIAAGQGAIPSDGGDAQPRAASSDSCVSRMPKQTEFYEPSGDFFRRELPREPSRMQSQQGARQADRVIEEIRGRLHTLAQELAKEKEQRKKAAAAELQLRRKVDASKRQKTLEAFFARQHPSHEARPRAPPAELGEGYTDRNISSGVFARHVKALEECIVQIAKDDPLKQLRQHRENGALDFGERAKPGQFFVSDHVMNSTDKFTLFAVAKDHAFREADDAIAANNTGQMSVSVGDFVVDAVRYSSVSAGGTVFTPTSAEIVVPVRAIIAFDLELEKLEQRRVFRMSVGNIEKWQLSSDDHAHILKMVSESLDDVVQAAVRNVSGRS